MPLLTPDKIRTLQRKLYHKAKLEPSFRFYALYDKIYRSDILSHAYHLVRSNKGSPGIDGVSFASIEAGEGKGHFLQKLQEELKSKSYHAQAVHRVWIPKPDGSERPLGIPTIRDRVVQMAVKLVVEPIFEADFCDTSYGFRPKRSAHDAADAVAESLLRRYSHVIDADLSKYFDTIPHAKLLAVVAERISDGGILWLIKQWLKAAVVEESKDGKRRTIGGGKGNRLGTPQGGVISPLLANLYLHLLDRIWERHDLVRRYGARIVRYADDLVILCTGSVDQPLRMLRDVLELLDLRLNETKTRIVNAYQESFDFLGFSFRLRKSRKSGKFYPHVEPSKRSVKRVKSRMKMLTDRKRTPIPLEDLVSEVNRSLRGWSGYFHYRNSTAVLGHVKWHVEERMRTHLRRRFKLASRAQAYHHLPTSKLYDRFGLFKLPTTAGWRKTNAL
jgi:group II intron reverse transcriptase/maturase